MGLIGDFDWYQSLRQGGRKDVTFTLTCENLLQSETFNCALIASQGLAQPKIFQNLKLKPKQSFSFNYDTVDWQWCDGDSFALIDSRNNILKQWPLQFHRYGLGECPECHGTKACGYCKGKGYTVSPQKLIDKCAICGGTGVCHTCYIPERKANYQPQDGPREPEISQETIDGLRRRIRNLRNSIQDLEKKIERCEWNLRMMEVRGQNVSSFSVYSSELNLKYRYECMLIEQRSKLDQLEDQYQRMQNRNSI